MSFFSLSCFGVTGLAKLRNNVFYQDWKIVWPLSFLILLSPFLCHPLMFQFYLCCISLTQPFLHSFILPSLVFLLYSRSFFRETSRSLIFFLIQLSLVYYYIHWSGSFVWLYFFIFQDWRNTYFNIFNEKISVIILTGKGKCQPKDWV